VKALVMELRDPFNPDGVFYENIRIGKSDPDDLTELTESMREFGWVKELPAFEDERGTIIVGHRRLKVAEELGIEPVIVRLDFGEGDEADAKRLRLALATNLGQKPLTASDRKSIAERLYGGGWTMARIGEALRVSKKTISQDLKELSPEVTIARTEKRGRPKGSANQQKAESAAREPTKLDPAVAAATRQERPKVLMQLAALLKIDTGKTLEEIVRALRDARPEIQALAKESRIATARGLLRALGVIKADLRPVG
jgi:ParB-like chromosome segregation protein Spo0J